MKLVDERKPIIEKLIMFILIVYTLSNLWGILIGIELNFFARLMITALLAVGVHFMISYPLVTTIVMTLTAIPLFVLNKYKVAGMPRVFNWIQQFIQNIGDYFSGTEHILSRNLIMFWILITFALCVVTWFLLMKLKQVWVLPVLYVPVFLYYWYIYVDAAYPMMIMFFVLYFIMMGGQQYFKAEKRWIKQKIPFKTGIYSNWVKTAGAYGLIIVLLAALLPKGNNLIDWYWLRDQLMDKYPAITDFRDDLTYGRSYGQAEIFTFSETGFQENPELGGPVILSDRLVMEVKSSYPFYLRGSVKSIYKNNRWEKERTKEWSKGINEELPQEVEDGTIVELDISYINMASYTIFAPYQPIRIFSDRKGRFNFDKNYELVKISGIYKNEEYTVRAIIPNQIKNDFPNVTTNFSNREEFANYLQLPEGLPPRVTELSNDITKRKYTPYEKAEAIRDYLRNNYSYTLEPSVTPSGKEFVDYFLFEEKQGYCTYFATAMSVMLRTQGIPTRYIEGYRMPDEKNDGKYEVRLNNAHAWVEAYIEPMGWVVFEPTPAFDGPPIVRSSRVGEDGVEGEEQVRRPIRDTQASQGDLSGADDLMAGMEDFERYSSEGDHEDYLAQLANKTLKLAPKILYILLVVGVLLRITYIHFRTKAYYRKLKREEGRTSIPSIYKNILDVLEAMEMPMEIGETPYEYSERIISRVYDNEHDLRKITNIYIRMQYSRENAEGQEVEKTLSCLWLMEKKLKVYWGFWRFFFKKYIKGEIIRPYNI